MTITPMLCTDVEPEVEILDGERRLLIPKVLCDPDRFTAEEKYDGWRLVVDHGEEGQLRIFGGRNSAEYTGQIPEVESVLALVIPPHTIVDGELVCSGDLGGLQSAMRTNRPYTGGDLTFVLFDVLRLSGQDTTRMAWSERRVIIEQWLALGDTLLTLTEFRVSPLLELKPDLLADVLANDGEGVVLKLRASRYQAGRSRSWVKLKGFQTHEATVVGFKPGEGSRAGRVGALEIEMLASGTRTSVGSGLTEALIDQITAGPQDWLGTVVEIKANQIGKDGAPRHPVFLRRRDDRTPVRAPKTLRVPEPSVSESRPRMRNYKAMNDDKLLSCLAQLEARAGEAHEKCVSRGGDPVDDIKVVRGLLRDRALIVS